MFFDPGGGLKVRSPERMKHFDLGYLPAGSQCLQW